MTPKYHSILLWPLGSDPWSDTTNAESRSPFRVGSLSLTPGPYWAQKMLVEDGIAFPEPARLRDNLMDLTGTGQGPPRYLEPFFFHRLSNYPKFIAMGPSYIWGINIHRVLGGQR